MTERPVGGAQPSMFGLRWITPTSLVWHARVDCRVLRAARRKGWVPFPITLGYGRAFYAPCLVCTSVAALRESHQSEVGS